MTTLIGLVIPHADELVLLPCGRNLYSGGCNSVNYTSQEVNLFGGDNNNDHESTPNDGTLVSGPLCALQYFLVGC